MHYHLSPVRHAISSTCIGGQRKHNSLSRLLLLNNRKVNEAPGDWFLRQEGAIAHDHPEMPMGPASHRRNPDHTGKSTCFLRYCRGDMPVTRRNMALNPLSVANPSSWPICDIGKSLPRSLADASLTRHRAM